MRKNKQQKGGGSSDYVGLFHSWGTDPAQLSRYTLQNIDHSPMFNPMKADTIIPTGTSGVIPTGSYYQSLNPSYLMNPSGSLSIRQMGGSREVLYTTKSGKDITNPWIAHVYKYAETHNISYSKAMRDPRVKESYKRS